MFEILCMLPRRISDEELNKPCDHEPEAFERFWAEYPNKFCKYEAKKSWDELKLPEPEISRLMAFVKECKDSGVWNCLNQPVSADWFLGDRIWERGFESYADGKVRVTWREGPYEESDSDGRVWFPGLSCSVSAIKNSIETQVV